jgi:hypothetical protein
MNEINFPLKHNPDVLSQKVRELIVLLNFLEKNYISFDEVGSCMWEAALKSSSKEHALQLLLEQFDVEETVLERDFVEFLQDCLARKLLQPLTS